jgi:hypothetical protein
VRRCPAGGPTRSREALQGGYDAHGEGISGALLRLLRVPAPDLAALADKLDLVDRHEVATLTGGEACLAAVRRDARLAGGDS